MSSSFRYIDERAAAGKAGTSVRTLQRLRREGGGPPYTKVSPRLVRYREDLLDEYLQSRTFPHRAAELVREVA